MKSVLSSAGPGLSAAETGKGPGAPGGEAESAKLARVAALINECSDARSGLIQVLHLAQTNYGDLPLLVQEMVAARMGLPLAQVAGVVSFYSFFSTVPRGEHVIRVCLGTACYIRGGKQLVDHLQETLGVEVGGVTEDLKFSCDVARCIGACGLAPAVMVDDVVHKQVTSAKLDAIRAEY
jgi:NADH:ubiquinone oxidoreductase subunit E